MLFAAPSCTGVGGQAMQYRACGQAGDQWRTVQHYNRKEDEKRRRSGANQNEASTRQVPSIPTPACRSPCSAEEAGTKWFLARWNTGTGCETDGPVHVSWWCWKRDALTLAGSRKGRRKYVNSVNSWNVSRDFGDLFIFYAIKHGYAAVWTVLMFLIPR